jgi:hypothetical protein
VEPVPLAQLLRPGRAPLHWAGACRPRNPQRCRQHRPPPQSLPYEPASSSWSVRSALTNDRIEIPQVAIARDRAQRRAHPRPSQTSPAGSAQRQESPIRHPTIASVHRPPCCARVLRSPMRSRRQFSTGAGRPVFRRRPQGSRGMPSRRSVRWHEDRIFTQGFWVHRGHASRKLAVAGAAPSLRCDGPCAGGGTRRGMSIERGARWCRVGRRSSSGRRAAEHF